LKFSAYAVKEFGDFIPKMSYLRLCALNVIRRYFSIPSFSWVEIDPVLTHPIPHKFSITIRCTRIPLFFSLVCVVFFSRHFLYKGMVMNDKEGWAMEEFGGAQVGDERLSKRLISWSDRAPACWPKKTRPRKRPPCAKSSRRIAMLGGFLARKGDGERD
jgi:hypothetical protein